MDYQKLYTKDYFTGKSSFFYPWGYGKFSKLYEIYFSNSFRLLRPYLQKIDHGRVLDIGCAFGFMLEQFPANFEKFGIDISEYAVGKAKKRLPNAMLQVAGAEDPLRFSKNSFDVITCNDVLEHLENPHVALKNIYQTLKPGGILYINTPNLNLLRKTIYAHGDKKENHISLFPHANLYKILKEVGFETVDHWTYFNFIFFFLPVGLSLGPESLFICKKTLH